MRLTPPPSSSLAARAFSLLEVMIACGIFFMAIFAILAMVASSLRNARSLRRIDIDAGMVAAQLFKTNRIVEGTDSGDFGDMYRDYTWETRSFEAATNGLWQVDIVVRRRGLHDPVDAMNIWIFSPESSALGGVGARR
jgi:Tfp pilus assembly protein PilV